MNDMDNAVTHYAEMEVQEQLECIKDVDFARLLQIYRILGCEARAGLSGHDVLARVVEQALSLERSWPRGLPSLSYLTQSGRSIISNAEEKHSKLVITATIDDLSSGDDEASKPSSATAKLADPAPEIHIEATQSKAIIAEWICKIQQLFEEDSDASCFIKQKLASQKKSKILILCEFTEQAYRNVEKRIKDKVRKRFPNGLPWWEVK